MNMPLDVAAAIVAGLSVVCIMGGVWYWRRNKIKASRLNRFVRFQRQNMAEERQKTKRKTESQLLLTMNRRFGSGKFGEKTQREIARAGLSLTASEYIFTRFGAGLFGLFVGLLVMPKPLTIFGLLIPLGLFLLGVHVPALFLMFKKHQRLVAFEKELPDALDVMQGSLRAGSSLLQAMEMVSREMSPPLAEEFGRAVREIGLGLPLEGAMLDMLDRVESQDLDILVTAITIQHRTGGNMAQIIETIALTIRERMRVRGEIRVLTSQQRLSAYIISILPIGLAAALFVINQPYMRKLFEPGLPRYLGIVAAISMVVGFLAMRRIAAIEV